MSTYLRHQAGNGVYAISNDTAAQVSTLGAVGVTVEDGADYGFSGDNIIATADASTVWSATATTGGFTFKNGDHYIYPGNVTVNSKTVLALWGNTSARACVLTGTAIYGIGSKNYYFTYSSDAGFGINTDASKAAHIDIYEKTAVSSTNIEITGYESIPDLNAGSAGSAVYATAADVKAALPTAVTIAGTSVTVPITSWADTNTYDPNAAGTYVFTGTLGTLPEGYVDGINPIATVAANVVIESTSGGGGGSGGTVIYKQVSSFAEDSEYIVTAKVDSNYYAMTLQSPANYAMGSTLVTVIDGAGYDLAGTNIIETADSGIVWTATAATNGFSLTNGAYSLYLGKVSSSSGATSGTGAAGVWGATSTRACQLTGTVLSAEGG